MLPSKTRGWDLLLSLVGHSGSTCSNGVGIAQVAALERSRGSGGGDDVHISIEFVQERHASGDVQLEDVFFRDVVQVLHQCAQTVAVSGDENVLACLEIGHDLSQEFRQVALTRQLQRFRLGDLILGQVAVSHIVARVVFTRLSSVTVRN
jgi:hypothetical protein